MQDKADQDLRNADVPEDIEGEEAEKGRQKLDMILSSSSSSEDMESDASFVGKNDDIQYKGNVLTKRKKEIQDEDIKYRKFKSNATCNVKEILSFVYGPSSSRFWMLRKHIN